MEDSELEDPKDEQCSHVYFDGTVNKRGRGIGAVLTSLQGQWIPFARKLAFECTNNEAEYEA